MGWSSMALLGVGGLFISLALRSSRCVCFGFGGFGVEGARQTMPHLLVGDNSYKALVEIKSSLLFRRYYDTHNA